MMASDLSGLTAKPLRKYQEWRESRRDSRLLIADEDEAAELQHKVECHQLEQVEYGEEHGYGKNKT